MSLTPWKLKSIVCEAVENDDMSILKINTKTQAHHTHDMKNRCHKLGIYNER